MANAEMDAFKLLEDSKRDPTKQIRLIYGTWKDSGHPWTFCQPVTNYEIRDTPEEKPDPYAELKKAAEDPTKQISVNKGSWRDSGFTWDWTSPVDMYEIRDKPSKWYIDIRGFMVMTTDTFPTEEAVKKAFPECEVIRRG